MKTLKYIIVLGFLLANVSYANLVWDANKGWQVQGGVLSNLFVGNANVENALQAMNDAKKEQENGNNRSALSYYNAVVEDYPNSIFAPEAYYQMALLLKESGQFWKAHEALNEVLRRYPDYPNFNLIIGEQYNIASIIQSGATPYLWGWFPWFTNYDDAIKIYESVVKNAPYSDYAPIALMNIAVIGLQENEQDISIDALDRLINVYPDSMFTPDAYLEMARVYESLVEGPYYDQASSRNALSFFKDYLILFPDGDSVLEAEQGIEKMEDTMAGNRLDIGDFYYYYRNNDVAAAIFYNETITVAANSKSAKKAEEMLIDISEGVIAPMTPYDWFWGRYEQPSIDEYEETDFEKLVYEHIESMQPLSVEDFIDEISQKNKAPEEFLPIFGEGLNEFLKEDGFESAGF